ncbi:hypothetical protein Gpo141_00009026 [Globisporangium polare]
MTTAADALQRQQRRTSSGEKGASAAGSLAQQIRSFNRQQFTNATSAHEQQTLDVESLLEDSDSDADSNQQSKNDGGYNGNADHESGFAAAHTITGYESEDDDVDEEEEAAFAMMNQLQLLQTRTVRKSAVGINSSAFGQHEAHNTKSTRASQQRPSVSAGMELTQAEERIAKLEAQLLDAEEAICHLKAEKLAAFRDVEKLTLALQKQQQQTQQQQVSSLGSDDITSTNSTVARKPESVNIWQNSSDEEEEEEEEEKPEQHGGDVSDDENNTQQKTVKELRAKLRRMEERLTAQQESQTLEQEEHMAVIREQEFEIQKLKLDLERMAETCEDLESRLYRAFQVDSPAASASSSTAEKRQGKSDLGTKFGNQGEHEDDDYKDDSVFQHRNHEALKDRRSSSVDSSTPISPGSESGSSAENFYSNAMQWREELVRHPTPHFDLDSPEVHYLLHSWTTNLQKLHYLRMWFTQVVTTRGPLAEDFPLGVELPRLLPEIRDGFLTLVVPLLRKQTQRDIHVHSRQYNDQFHTDLRIRVVPRRC